MGSSSTNSIAATGFHYDVWNCDHLENKWNYIADADAQIADTEIVDSEMIDANIVDSDADAQIADAQIADVDADESCLPPDYAAALMDRHSQEVQTPFKFH